MRTTIRETELQTLFAEAQQNGESIFQHKGSDLLICPPSQVGSGQHHLITLRDGIVLKIADGRFHQTTTIESHRGPDEPLVSKFCLSSRFQVQTPRVSGIPEDYTESAGHHYLFSLSDVVEFETFQGEERFQVVAFEWSQDYVRSFISAADGLPQPLQKLSDHQTLKRFHQPLGKMTPAMAQIIQQVLGCPYQGMVKKMYLESKALELLTLQLTAWSENQHQTKISQLLPDDLERIQQASHVLNQNLNAPPSLMGLARQVGLNDYKLKLGFRQMFGTTVFGYSQAKRLQYARQLLAAQDLSIPGVAQSVGYASPTSFTAAFKRRFGLSPKAYQMACRGKNPV
ncbi:helix-turn-helix transcriptional regulator [Acaryochloris marina]|uniref:Transcriptional regulator, AraC family n=1 Tax=Acaryochloris marina (strain MBIC 11017) TaxID=329726 RepID=B0C029_ACAM1|nr:AraC family transcriptional regulator [Acaryochloris marina]ABW28376.1 transcriptional regulator, AraC family [Acaryochloris marina MBIC11017]